MLGRAFGALLFALAAGIAVWASLARPEVPPAMVRIHVGDIVLGGPSELFGSWSRGGSLQRMERLPNGDLVSDAVVLSVLPIPDGTATPHLPDWYAGKGLEHHGSLLFRAIYQGVPRNRDRLESGLRSGRIQPAGSARTSVDGFDAFIVEDDVGPRTAYREKASADPITIFCDEPRPHPVHDRLDRLCRLISSIGEMTDLTYRFYDYAWPSTSWPVLLNIVRHAERQLVQPNPADEPSSR